MGGAMNADEEERYPWLAGEKRAIERAIAARKHVLGICLGSQLIARVLGARVTRNRHTEIGWFPIERAEGAQAAPWARAAGAPRSSTGTATPSRCRKARPSSRAALPASSRRSRTATACSRSSSIRR
jgi:GMP synthase-like glutamine amidotransferase